MGLGVELDFFAGGQGDGIAAVESRNRRQVIARKKVEDTVHQFTEAKLAVARWHPISDHQINILARPFIEAKLKITGKKNIFRRVALGRQNSVAAVIGKFETDDVAGLGYSVVPLGISACQRGSRTQGRIVFEPA
ncbi:MAG TPA: hypothetical protein VGA27_00170 [Candidatus Binatia bacterium]